MDNSTKAIGKIAIFILFNFALFFGAFGQGTNIVSLSSSVPAQWTTVDLVVVPGDNNVTIMTGDTISLDILGTCSKLTIDKGAVLNSISNAVAGNLYCLQAGGATAPGIDTIENDGVFGSATGANDGIALAIPATCASIKLLGSGITAIGAIRPVSFNSKLTFDLAQNASLNYNGVAFSAHPVIDSNTTVDNITFNIDTGITLKLINSHGQVQGLSADGIGGNYIYNIYGTLDLTATKDTQNFVPYYTSAASIITINVSGKLELGSGFNSVSSGSASSGGKVVFNILDGGLVDATNTKLMTMGTNYFTTIGTGVLKREVDNTTVVFPVGAAGSSTFSPVALNNKGTVTNFSVSVKNQFNYGLPNSTRVVNKQWTVIPDNQGSNVAVTPVWLTADQAPGFNAAAPVSVVNYNGTNLVQTPATVSGLGTNIHPFAATAAGFTTFGLFGIENSPNGMVLNIQVFPNPTTQLINVTFPATVSNGTITITTSGGQPIVISTVNGNIQYSANIASYPPGTYIVTLVNQGISYSRRFIKL